MQFDHGNDARDTWGDVTINNLTTLQIDAPEVIGNGATLTLDGVKDTRKNSKLILYADETVAGLIIDGVDQVCHVTANQFELQRVIIR